MRIRKRTRAPYTPYTLYLIPYPRTRAPYPLSTLSQVNVRMGTAEVGYQVNPNFRRQGIGSKVLPFLLDEVFTKTELRKLIATIAIENIPSCKIVEKVGFVREGVLRKQFIINDIPTDQLFYGLLCLGGLGTRVLFQISIGWTN